MCPVTRCASARQRVSEGSAAKNDGLVGEPGERCRAAECGATGGLRDSRIDDERKRRRGERGGSLQLLHVVPRPAPPDKERGSERQIGARRAARIHVFQGCAAGAWILFTEVGRGHAPHRAGLDGDVPARGDAEHSDAPLGPRGGGDQEDCGQRVNEAHKRGTLRGTMAVVNLSSIRPPTPACFRLRSFPSVAGSRSCRRARAARATSAGSRTRSRRSPRWRVAAGPRRQSRY